MKQLFVFFLYELKLRLRGSAGPSALGFFTLAGVLSPLAIGTDAQLLRDIAAGLIWVFVSLAALLGLEGFFKDDLTEGRFAVLRLSAQPLWLIMVVMMVIYWLTVCAPVILAAVPILFIFGVPPAAIWSVILALIVGTPALAFIGACLGAICAGLQRGTGLVIFLALPFFAPALILGAQAANGGEGAQASLLFLAAFSLVSVAFCPILGALAIRQNMT